MSKQANPTVIGGFVLGTLALAVGAIILLSGGVLLRERVPMVTYFPGSVQGLAVGAQVQFEGVGVGRVTGIALDYSPAGGTFSIPVSYELWPDQVRIQGAARGEPAAAILRRLVREQGLHARLESLSLVTGQYGIALSLVPGRNSPLRHDPADAVEVPALEATRDRVAGMLGNLRLDALVEESIRALAALRGLIDSGELARLLASLDATLGGARELFAHLDARVGPLGNRLDATLAEYAALAVALEGRARRLETGLAPLSVAAARTLDEASRTLRSVETLAREGTQTARAVRGLADALERHPEALLRGRR